MAFNPGVPSLVLRAWIAVVVAVGGVARGADAPPPTFEEHVLPILREKCCGCHNADKRKGDLDLSSYGQAFAGGSSGDVIEPGDPDGSYLWQLVTHASEPRMPPDADKLPAESLDVIKRWIAAGAIERLGAKPVARTTSAIALEPGAVAAPEGPPVMPPRLSLEVVSVGRRPTTVTALAASPHGEVVAVGSRKQVLLYHAATRDLLGVLAFPEGVARVVRFSRNGRLLLAAGGAAAKSGRVVVWDVATGGRVAEVGEEFDEVLAADISPDQRLVALGGPARVVRILRTADGSIAAEVKRHTDWVTALEFSPNGKFLATGDRAGNLFLWETRGAREAGVLKGHGGQITAVAWRGDGAVMASGSLDGTVKLWNAKDATQAKSWNAHGGGVEGIAWLADGRLVTTGRDARAKLWKADGTLEREFPPLADIGTRVTATSDRTKILAGDWAGVVTVFATADGAAAGTLDTNPPRLEKRIEQAQRELDKLAAATAPAAEKAQAAAKAVELAESQMAAARKAADEAAAELEAAEARKAEAAEALDRWKAEVEFSKSAPAPASPSKP